MALDFRKVNKTITGNSQTVSMNPSINLKDLVNFSTNSTTTSYNDQRQSYWNNQQSSNTTNLFAINSNGVSADGRVNPSMSTTPTTTNRTDGGSAGINANTIILGVVIIAALYFGIQYLDKS